MCGVPDWVSGGICTNREVQPEGIGNHDEPADRNVERLPQLDPADRRLRDACHASERLLWQAGGDTSYSEVGSEFSQ